MTGLSRARIQIVHVNRKNSSQLEETANHELSVLKLALYSQTEAKAKGGCDTHSNTMRYIALLYP